jgi:hypothetical protein
VGVIYYFTAKQEKEQGKPSIDVFACKKTSFSGMGKSVILPLN